MSKYWRRILLLIINTEGHPKAAILLLDLELHSVTWLLRNIDFHGNPHDLTGSYRDKSQVYNSTGISNFGSGGILVFLDISLTRRELLHCAWGIKSTNHETTNSATTSCGTLCKLLSQGLSGPHFPHLGIKHLDFLLPKWYQRIRYLF
jgi:hypothetical protein